MLKIAISGLIYPVTMMRYFWDALDRRDDLEVFSIGPYFGSWIPWGGGMEIAPRYVKTPTIPLSREMASHHIHPGMLKGMIPNDIDLWLQVDAGWNFSVRPPAKKVALIETDPHVLKGHYAAAKSYSDVTFCMQTPYQEIGEVWLPYANDPTKFYPDKQPDILGVSYDACLVGLHYPQRDVLVKHLFMDGKRVYYDLGKVYDEYRALYNASRVALSWSSLKDTPVRVFEAMGMGVPLVANRTPDLELLFEEGVDYLGFDTVEEAVSQVNTILDNPDFGQTLANSAYTKVQERHTWDHRIQFILETMRML
jgi:hypothetical protein